jgi:hypothetical protein
MHAYVTSKWTRSFFLRKISEVDPRISKTKRKQQVKSSQATKSEETKTRVGLDRTNARIVEFVWPRPCRPTRKATQHNIVRIPDRSCSLHESPPGYARLWTCRGPLAQFLNRISIFPGDALRTVLGPAPNGFDTSVAGASQKVLPPSQIF